MYEILSFVSTELLSREFLFFVFFCTQSCFVLKAKQWEPELAAWNNFLWFKLWLCEFIIHSKLYLR